MTENLEKIEVFPWNPNFATGIKQIDDQHKVLIELLNKLANTLVHDDPVEVVIVFDELAKYASFHFESEEEIWSKYLPNDSWLDSHLMSHSSFLPRVLTIKEQGKDKNSQDVIEDIVRFLIRWLAFHIIDDDKKMSLVVQGTQNGLSLGDAKIQADKKMNGSIRVLIDNVLSMYDNLSSRALDLMRERNKRKKVEEELIEANRKLEISTITDQLTGLYNRRHFEQVFYQELARSRREKTTLSLISMDLDFFKEINDHYGHLRGDKVLREISQCFLTFCQHPGDYAFRIGGEEFLILLGNVSEQNAIAIAEKIRTSIKGMKIPNAGSIIDDYLTVSVGVITTTPDDDDTIDSLLRSVDQLLYQAKREGRNKVKSYTSAE